MHPTAFRHQIRSRQHTAAVDWHYAANRASAGASEKFTLQGHSGSVIDHQGAYLKAEVPTIHVGMGAQIPGNLWPSPNGQDGAKTYFNFVHRGGNEFNILSHNTYYVTADQNGLVSMLRPNSLTASSDA